MTEFRLTPVPDVCVTHPGVGCAADESGPRSINLPTRLSQRFGSSKASVYVTGENLWTYSPLFKYVNNVDPESISAGSDMILTIGTSGDGLNYPIMKTFVFGINVGF